MGRLEDIKEEIKELMHEAKRLVQSGAKKANRPIIYERAKSYWLPHIFMALDKDHDYLGGSMTTMEDTINEIGDDDEESADSDECDECGNEIPPGEGPLDNKHHDESCSLFNADHE